MVRDFGLVSSLLFGFVLERQQVGLLLLQALMESLSLALLLQLPPLELLLQSAGSIRDDEKRIRPYKHSTKYTLRVFVTTFVYYTLVKPLI